MNSRPVLGPVHERTDRLSERELSACAALSGEESERPLGIAFVLALRTLIESGVFPDGGIMLGHQATWFREPWIGAYRTELSIVAIDPPRTRYQRVVLGYRIRGEDGDPFAEQQQEVLWPIT